MTWQHFKTSQNLEYAIFSLNNSIEVKIHRSIDYELAMMLINLKKSLSVEYNIRRIGIGLDSITFFDFNDISAIQNVIENYKQQSYLVEHRKVHVVDITYDIDAIKLIAEQINLTVEEIIQLHQASKHYIALIGFLPGFIYIGGLHQDLHLPRKKTPSTRMDKGSIAIANGFTGIYPQSSPGGWNVIGHTNFNLFDASKQNPSPFNVGDLIKFKVV